MIVDDRALRYWYGSQKQQSSFLHTTTNTGLILDNDQLDTQMLYFAIRLL